MLSSKNSLIKHEQDPDQQLQRLKKSVDPARIPRHVGIIMDGNGRWAKERNLKRSAGHEAGANVIESLLDAVQSLNIQAISLYSFSKENWSRPKDEVNFLWNLLVDFFNRKMARIKEKNIKIIHSGEKDELPKMVQMAIRKAEKETEQNTATLLNFCINYGARQEIVRAVKKNLEDRLKNQLKTEVATSLDKSIADILSGLDEKSIERYLYTADLPDLDLVIRTSGEYRISNFFLWQIAYAEIWVTEKYWPDFSEVDLYQAVLDYQKRDRRFGGL